MPEVTGIQLLKSITLQPLIVFTTAYKEYAVEGFDMNVLDYLIKPISFERFLKAASKANEYMAFKQQRNLPKFDKDILFVKTDYKIIKIVISEILYIEGLKDYVKIFTREKNPLITLKSMTYFENKLPVENFMRVHRSFIVAINKIDSISKNRIIIGDKYIPISLSFKEQFYKVINSYL
jgi:DNA-binding LytR/AlgR family response regulator